MNDYKPNAGSDIVFTNYSSSVAAPCNDSPSSVQTALANLMKHIPLVRRVAADVDGALHEQDREQSEAEESRGEGAPQSTIPY